MDPVLLNDSDGAWLETVAMDPKKLMTNVLTLSMEARLADSIAVVMATFGR